MIRCVFVRHPTKSAEPKLWMGLKRTGNQVKRIQRTRRWRTSRRRRERRGGGGGGRSRQKKSKGQMCIVLHFTQNKLYFFVLFWFVWFSSCVFQIYLKWIWRNNAKHWTSIETEKKFEKTKLKISIAIRPGSWIYMIPILFAISSAS